MITIDQFHIREKSFWHCL